MLFDIQGRGGTCSHFATKLDLCIKCTDMGGFGGLAIKCEYAEAIVQIKTPKVLNKISRPIKR